MLPACMGPHAHDQPDRATVTVASVLAGSRIDRQQLCFVYEVARRAAVPTWPEALTVTRTVLRALAEWLDPPQRHALARHLPGDLPRTLTAVVTDPRRDEDVVALYRAVASELQPTPSLHEAALCCAAVLAVMGEALPEGLLARLCDRLPADVAALVAAPREAS